MNAATRRLDSAPTPDAQPYSRLSHDPPPPRIIFPSESFDLLSYLDSLRRGPSPGGVARPDSLRHVAAGVIADRGIAKAVGHNLSSKAITPSLRPGTRTQRVVRHYCADVEALQGELDAYRRLLGTIATAQTEIVRPGWMSWEVQSATQRDRLAFVEEHLSAQAQCHLGVGVATADLIARGPEALLTSCNDDIRRRIGLLSGFVARVLTLGVATGLLGVVRWPGAESAWYVRNTHQYHVTKERVSQRGRGHSQVQLDYEHRLACTEVHLMEAARLDDVPGWLKVPSSSAAVVAAIPWTLRPFVSTVVGTVIRQREIAWVVGQAKTSHEVVRPIPVPHFDPAVVIFSPDRGLGIVLTSWEADPKSGPGLVGRLHLALVRR